MEDWLTPPRRSTWEPDFRSLDQEVLDMMLALQWATPQEIQRWLNQQLTPAEEAAWYNKVTLATLQVDASVPVQ